MAALMGASQASVGKKRANVERIGLGRDSATRCTSVYASAARVLTLSDATGTHDVSAWDMRDSDAMSGNTEWGPSEQSRIKKY
ncbi:hypothetical protein PHISCL_09809 [Aspergillus sclerotialis]|uniref:Uncharacterized protein n=1 Tax=Aspergillus sclerotialis TaxID=2070753 RepID=A0A3A2Z457_9EURO|nr:hypothetical protein PHISCL_09809 [Aspergillus sclerotialis]